MKYVTALLLLIVLGSCMSRKYVARVSQPDYNGRQVIAKPHYHKKGNAVGTTFMVGTTLAGGVLGYEREFVKINTDEKVSKPLPIANAVLGAGIGYGLYSFVSHVLLGQGSRNYKIDKEKFIRKKVGSDKRMIRYRAGDITVIDPSVQSTYQVRNLKDVEDYFLAFRDAVLYDKERIIGNAIGVVQRNELPQLISLMPSTTHKSKIQEQYLDRSTSWEQVKDGISKYPHLEERGLAIIEKRNYKSLMALKNERDAQQLVMTGAVIAGGLRLGHEGLKVLGGLAGESNYVSAVEGTDYKVMYSNGKYSFSEDKLGTTGFELDVSSPTGEVEVCIDKITISSEYVNKEKNGYGTGSSSIEADGRYMPYTVTVNYKTGCSLGKLVRPPKDKTITIEFYRSGLYTLTIDND